MICPTGELGASRECGGNVHGRSVVEITSRSLELVGTQQPYGATGAKDAAEDAAELEVDSCFYSAYRKDDEDIPHSRNTWLCTISMRVKLCRLTTQSA
jgi:hypothetical protein